MNIRTIKAKALNKENFKRYGEVISMEGDYTITNQGTGNKWDDLVHFDMYENGGRVNLGILKTKPMELQFDQMERHHFTSQIFIPLEGKSSVVAVAPDSEVAPNPNEVEVFLLEGNQGISFFRKTWHRILMPLEGETAYILMARGGDIEKDVEFKSLDIQFVIDEPAAEQIK